MNNFKKLKLNYVSLFSCAKNSLTVLVFFLSLLLSFFIQLNFFDTTQVFAMSRYYSLENSKVQAFMDDVTYDSNYSKSKIKKYSSGSSGKKYDRPAAVLLTFDATYGKVKVKLATNSRMTANANTLYFSGSKGYAAVYNLIPGKYYYYTITDAYGDEIKKGNFNTSRYTVRMCYVDGVRNVRDIGGLRTSSGRHIKYGVIYRGGQMDGGSKISSSGKSTMKNILKIKYDIDLRSSKEAKHASSSPIGSSASYMRYSVSSYSITGDNKKLYKQILKTVFKAAKKNKAVYIHCAAGADRTGTVCYIIEGLLGVSESDMCKEYELTSFYQTRERKNLLNVVKQLKKYKGDTIQEKIENYCISIGLKKSEIKTFRKNMLGS